MRASSIPGACERSISGKSFLMSFGFPLKNTRTSSWNWIDWRYGTGSKPFCSMNPSIDDPLAKTRTS